MKQIKCIIFDFGRVIGNFDHMITCSKLSGFSVHSADEIYRLIFKSGLEKQYDEGLDFKTFYDRVREAIGANQKLTIEMFAEMWGDIFSENDGIQKVLEKINPDIKILLLSNTNQVHWIYISKIPAIEKFFGDRRRLILSFELGFRKPDKRIFKEGVRKSECKPDEIIYVDDVPEYIEAVRNLGINGILYNCQTDPIEKLQNELSQFGVLK
ncbi:MAG: HAD-IA family hydrolase [bacterium]|nr:HAD-IA family hydrolase [bacterium]